MPPLLPTSLEPWNPIKFHSAKGIFERDLWECRVYFAGGCPSYVNDLGLRVGYTFLGTVMPANFKNFLLKLSRFKLLRTNMERQEGPYRESR